MAIYSYSLNQAIIASQPTFQGNYTSRNQPITLGVNN